MWGSPFWVPDELGYKKLREVCDWQTTGTGSERWRGDAVESMLCAELQHIPDGTSNRFHIPCSTGCVNDVPRSL
jgi:hypothetical protein